MQAGQVLARQDQLILLLYLQPSPDLTSTSEAKGAAVVYSLKEALPDQPKEGLVHLSGASCRDAPALREVTVLQVRCLQYAERKTDGLSAPLRVCGQRLAVPLSSLTSLQPRAARCSLGHFSPRAEQRYLALVHAVLEKGVHEISVRVRRGAARGSGTICELQKGVSQG